MTQTSGLGAWTLTLSILRPIIDEAGVAVLAPGDGLDGELSRGQAQLGEEGSAGLECIGVARRPRRARRRALPVVHLEKAVGTELRTRTGLWGSEHEGEDLRCSVDDTVTMRSPSLGTK